MKKGIVYSEEAVKLLPKWAQRMFALCVSERDLAVRKLKNFLDSLSPSKVYTWELLEDRKHFIQDNQIYFELDNGRKISVRNNGDRIELMGVGWGALEITPHVSNVITVKLSDE